MESSENPELSTADVAAMLGVKRRTVTMWRFRGVGPPYRRLFGAGGPIVYLRDDVEAWAKARKRGARL